MATKYRLSDFFEAKEIVVIDKKNDDKYTLTLEFSTVHSENSEFSRKLYISGGVIGNMKILLFEQIEVKDVLFNMVINSSLRIPYAKSEYLIKDCEIEITKRGKVIFHKHDGIYKFAEDDAVEEKKDEDIESKTDE